jgi:hypothetical protein
MGKHHENSDRNITNFLHGLQETVITVITVTTALLQGVGGLF